MTPKEIIEALQEYFKDREDETINQIDLGLCILDAIDKENLIELMEMENV